MNCYTMNILREGFKGQKGYSFLEKCISMKNRVFMILAFIQIFLKIGLLTNMLE